MGNLLALKRYHQKGSKQFRNIELHFWGLKKSRTGSRPRAARGELCCPLLASFPTWFCNLAPRAPVGSEGVGKRQQPTYSKVTTV